MIKLQEWNMAQATNACHIHKFLEPIKKYHLKI